jgi:antirestriction protein ArdC
MVAKREIYQEITQTIIQAIEEGAGDFKMPWHNEGMRPVNALTQASYRGINVLQLMISQSRSVFTSAYWETFKQWQELGAKVKIGEL